MRQDINWSNIYPFMPNPAAEDHPVGSPAYTALTYFAGNYTEMISALHSVFNGHPEDYFPMLSKMYGLGGMATTLMQTPDPRFPVEANVRLGPVWVWMKNVSKYHQDWKGYSPQPPRPSWGC
jgi:hypothetical protein